MTILPFSQDEVTFLATRMYMPKAIQSNPTFMSTIAAVNGLINDPGDLGTTITAIRATIAIIEQFETQLNNNYTLMFSTEVEGEVRYNAINQDMYWRYITGPALINDLSVHLCFPPAGNYYAPVKPQTRGYKLGRRYNPNQTRFR